MMNETEVRELIIANLKLVGATGVLENKDPAATVRALAHVLTGTDPQKLLNPKVDYHCPRRELAPAQHKPRGRKKRRPWGR